MYYGEGRTIKIPVKVVNGQLRYFYGGDLPEIEEGAIGELILLEGSIRNKNFLEILQAQERVEILPQWSTIMVAVNVENCPDDKRTFLRKIKTDPPTSNSFVEVVLKEALYLIIRGSKRATLDNVKCFIPSLNMETNSLNEAYTKISQAFEPKRRSYTGNVFKKCYYRSQSNGDIWYPLDSLREIEEEKYEENLVLDYKVFSGVKITKTFMINYQKKNKNS